MKQILQSIRNGSIELASVPRPALHPGQVLVASSRTLVSAGTERMLMEFGKASVLGKVLQQPEKARMIWDKIRTDGFLATLQAVNSKLDQPLALGYCNAGSVVGIGEGVTGFSIGDRVASNGRHAEVVCVPSTLCARIPERVTDDEAAFAVIGAIALQGIRLAQPTLGESVAVMGLGLVGLMSVQLLRIHGCRVLGVDFDKSRLGLARDFGAETVDLSAGEDPVAAARTFSRDRGLDAVIIAAATRSSDVVHQAALACRKRGRIVMVGSTGMELSRADFYDKELTLQVSCSYGPGRYDPSYEERAVDYPVGFVRWTAQRNIEAVLDMMADGRLDVKPLISHRFPVGEAQEAYRLLDGKTASLGILLEYPNDSTEAAIESPGRSNVARRASGSPSDVASSIGVIGAGNYAAGVLIPAFKSAGAHLRCVASATGVAAAYAGRKFGFDEVTTNLEEMFSSPAIGTIVIATRHDSHARLACQALAAGKHVYVEKPLAINEPELEGVERAHDAAVNAGWQPVMAVGFNRRFAPHIVKMRSLLDGSKGPKAFIMTVNAGMIPPDHWLLDPKVGGGRVVGEACHFVDLLRFLAAARITGFTAVKMDAGTGDTVSINLDFADGSIGTIHYLANGNKSFPKERLEVFAGGRVLQLDNFRLLTGYGWPGFKSMRLWRQDKGHQQHVAAFLRAVRAGATAPIPTDELFEVTRWTIRIAQAISRGDQLS